MRVLLLLALVGCAPCPHEDRVIMLEARADALEMDVSMLEAEVDLMRSEVKKVADLLEDLAER